MNPVKVPEFIAVHRKKGKCVTTVQAAMTEWPGAEMTVYFDNEGRDVAYPVRITFGSSVLTFVLDSDDVSSCSFPPSVPESMVDDMSGMLDIFHDYISAAREFIRKESKARVTGA